MKKTAKIIIGLLLTALGLPTASAQQTQDALYIFRNDGQFNAFFWGDIQRFAYSKVDTLGIEHDDYVVQEIYALDSVFRIPVSAIDSIAFVTPENKVKSDVFQPGRQIGDYIVASDSLYWIRLAPSTPQALIPKKGDKLLIEEASRFIPDGFGGLVTAVTQGSDGYTVTTEGLELKDVYDVLVLKTGGVQQTENQNARSRRASGDADYSWDTGGPLALPALSATLSLVAGQYKMTDEGAPIQVSLDGSLDLSGSLTPIVDFQAFLYLNTLCNQDRYYQVAKFNNQLDVSLALTGAVTAHADIPFTFAKDILKSGLKCALKEAGKKLAVNMGPFLVDFSFGLYLEAQGSLTSNYTWSNKHVLNTTYQYDRNIFWDTWEDFYSYNCRVDCDTTTWTLAAGKFALSTGVFAQAEAGVTLPIIKKKSSVALRFDAGLKAEFDVPIFSNDAYLPLIDTPNLYNDLNFDETVTLSTPVNLSFALNIGKWAWTPKLAFALVEPMTGGVVPNIFGLKWHDEKAQPYRFTVESPVTRQLLLPVDVGFALFDEDDKLVDSSWDWPYRNDNVIKSVKHVFETLDPVKDKGTVYTVYPQIRFLGHPILADRHEKIVIGKARIDISEKQIAAGEDMSGHEIDIVPNMKNIELKCNAPWLSFIHFDTRGQLSIHWEGLPEKINDRRGVIYVTGKNKDGEVLVEDSIVIIQARSVLDLSAEKLNFEKAGGTKTVRITRTNLTDITVRSSNDYAHPSVKDSTVTIVMDRNTGPDRMALIYVEGKNPNGENFTAYISAYQEGTGEDPTPQPGEDIDVETFTIDFQVDELTLTSVNDPNPDRSWGVGEGPQFPLLLRETYATPEETDGKVAATIGDDAIHVTVNVVNESTEFYRDTNSPIEEYEILPGTRSYILEFDIEKYLDDKGKPAARIANMTVIKDWRVNWSDKTYELHRLKANIDPSAVKAVLLTDQKYDFSSGSFVTVGYKGIRLSYLTANNGLHISNLSYDFTYYYSEVSGWDDDDNPIYEYHRYDASYRLEKESSWNSLDMEITFPESVQEGLMTWFQQP